MLVLQSILDNEVSTDEIKTSEEERRGRGKKMRHSETSSLLRRLITGATLVYTEYYKVFHFVNFGKHNASTVREKGGGHGNAKKLINFDFFRGRKLMKRRAAASDIDQHLSMTSHRAPLHTTVVAFS